MSRVPLLLLLLLAMVLCVNDAHTDVAAVRTLIDADLQRGVDATRNKDIEAYMSLLPPDLLIHDESGEKISRDQQRANALRD